MIFPKVKHKIPSVFQEIISNDEKRFDLKNSPVIDINLFKDLKDERNRLRIGADNFVIKQKGGKT